MLFSFSNLITRPVSVRHIVLLLFCAALPSCHSEGQTENDESGYFHRRKIPEYVAEALPTTTDTLGQTAHFVFLGHGKIDPYIFDKLMEKSERLAAKIHGFSFLGKTAQPVSWHIYPSSEVKGLMLKNSSPIHYDFGKMEIHSVANDIFKNYYDGLSARLLLRQLYGKPKRPELELGLAIWNDEKWQGLGFKKWGIRLAAAGGLPTLSELLDTEKWENCSQLIYGTAMACLVDF